jgi:4-alpha-glucanotransferase
MMSELTDPLRYLAGLYGALTEFHDNSGKRYDATPEALIRVLRGLGSSIDHPEQATQAIRERELAVWQRRVEPVQLYWDGFPVPVRLRIPARLASEKLQVTLQMESGEQYQWTVQLGPLPARDVADLGGQRFVAKEIPLIHQLPLGYHHLNIGFPDTTVETMILSAPTRAHAAAAGTPKTWGIFAPLYALRSERNWGAGDFGDLERLMDWTCSLGGGLVASLPLLAAFLDEPFEPGPYSPASRLFWNEFYLDMARIPELERSPRARKLMETPEFQAEIAAQRAAPLVDHRGQMALKRRVLDELARTMFAEPSARRTALEQHLVQHPDLETYARFRAVGDKLRTSWRQWPARLRDGKLLPGDWSEDARNYHAYVQWLCREQLQAFADRSTAAGPGFYLDLPLGVNPDSFDIWRERRLFVENMAGGAPPDPFFTAGQNWGFPPQHPERMRESGYRYPRACLAHLMQFAGLLRIDHLMGLHRFYWVPAGMDARQGVYVRYPADELYGIYTLESHRHKTVLIGEDLGTVPPEVPAAMQRHGLDRMYVVQ